MGETDVMLTRIVIVYKRLCHSLLLGKHMCVFDKKYVILYSNMHNIAFYEKTGNMSCSPHKVEIRLFEVCIIWVGL